MAVKPSYEELEERVNELEKEVSGFKDLESERTRLIAILENTSDYVSAATPDAKLTYLNKAGRKLVGFGEDEDITNKAITDIHPKWALDIIENTGIPTSIENGIWEDETALLVPSGKEIPISQVIISHKSSDEKPEYFSTIIRDISKQKEAEEALRDSEKKYRLLIDNCSDPINVFDVDGNILLMNKTSAKNLGGMPEDFVGKSVKDVLPHMKDLIDQLICSIVETGESCNFENVFELPSGKMWFITNIHPVRNSSGKIYAVHTISYDITDSKRAEEKIRILNKELKLLVEDRTAELKEARKDIIKKEYKSELADITTGTLHNVKNILSSVKTSSDFMRKILHGDSLTGFKRANEMLRENIGNIENFICNDPKGKKLMEFYLKIEEVLDKEVQTTKKHMNRLREKVNAIENIVTTQQSYGGSIPVREHLEIIDIIEDALTMQMESIKNHSINVTKEHKRAPKINVEKTKLMHILINLINNAKDAMLGTPTEKRSITISTDSDDSYVFIKVKDTGNGISSEDFNNIFTHGFTTKKDGHGFGLHSCASYMKEMHGEMWAESQGEGKGAEFVLKFPHS